MADRRSFLRLVALVAWRDYTRTVRRRGFLFGTALLPLAIGGFVLLSSLSAPTVERAPYEPSSSISVVNESSLVIVAPPNPPVVSLARADAERMLERGELREFYLIPPGYPAQPTIQRLVGPASGPGIEDLQRRADQERLMSRVLIASLLAEEELPAQTRERLTNPFDLRETAADGVAPAPGFEAAFVVPYAFTFLFVMSIFITSGYLLQSVTEEKENRVVEILLSSVPSLPLMTGKIVGLGAAGLTQVAVWVIAALAALPLLAGRVPGLSGVTISPVTLLLALCFFIVGYLAYGAIFAAIGALAPGTREAQQYSGFFGFFAVIPLIFAGAFIANIGSPLVTILALVPLTAPAAMLQVLALVAEPPWPLVVASLASLGVFAGLATVAASRVFRATLLLYGVRPSIRRIVGAITARS